jgi:hypothetical protein
VRDVNPEPRDDDDDDLDLLDELPVLPPLGEGDEVVGLEGPAFADELDTDDEEPSALSVDEGVGPTDDFDDDRIELSEEASVLDDVREAALDLGEDDIDDQGGEYGWTGGDEAPGTSALDFVEEEVEEPEVESEDDGGEEGVDEGAEGSPSLAFEGEDAVAGLPPLRRDEEGGDELADDLDLEDDADIELGELPFEDEARLMGASLPPPRAVRAHVRYHGAVVDVARAGDTLFLVGDELVRVSSEGTSVLAASGLGAEELLGVSVRDDVMVVGTRLGGAFRSTDGGRSFSPANGWRSGHEPSVGCRVAADAGGRLWLWAGGALYRSDDFGARWAGPVLPAPVVAANLDEVGRLVVACASATGLDVLRASDDGRGFRALVPSASGAPREAGAVALAVVEERVAIAREGDPQGPSVFRDGAWTRAPELAGCHALAWVGEVLYGATHVAAGDRGLVLACAFSGASRDVSVVLDLDALPRERSGSGAMTKDGDWLGEGVPEEHRIFALRPGARSLFVACGAGLVELALEEQVGESS